MTDEPKKTGISTSCIVFSILAFPLTFLVFAGLISAIISVVLGHISLTKIKRSSDTYRGKKRAIVGLVISYCYIAFVSIIIAVIITNRESTSPFYLSDTVSFSIHVPLKGSSSEWQIKDQDMLGVVLAPKETQIKKEASVSNPYVPSDSKCFEFLSISYIPKKYDKSLKDVCRQLVQGTVLFDQAYKADDPKDIVISKIQSSCFREYLDVDGAAAKGISFLIPVDQGYYILRFRADNQSYNESFYNRIAHTFSPSGV